MSGGREGRTEILMRLLELLANAARQHDATLTITTDGVNSTVSWKVRGRRAERVSTVNGDATPSELLFALLKRILIYGDVSAADILHEATR
jgi:hypothetical protein